MKTSLSDASQKRSVAVRGGSWAMIVLYLASFSLAADDPSQNATHLLYLADNGLVVIRLSVDIDGEPQRELCRMCLDAICREADRDADGFIVNDEYDARIANHPVFQERQSRMPRRGMNAALPRPEFLEGQLTIAQTADFLARRMWSPVVLEFGGTQLQRINAAGNLLDRPIADAKLFERLDADGNRHLTRRELEKAGDLLAKLDFDEDETLSLDELRMQSVTPAVTTNPGLPARQTDGQLSLLPAGRIDAQFVRRILTRYDGAAKGSIQDLKLDRHEVGIAEDLFAEADADEDGFWDFDELRRFLEHPTTAVEIAVHLVTGLPTAAETTCHDVAAVKVLVQDAGVINFDLHGTLVRFVLPPGKDLTSKRDQSWKLAFQSLDGDKNEYLESSEFPFDAENGEVSPTFKQMDADRNEKVYLDEYLAYQLQSQKARASQIVIHAENLERTLFGPLDGNSDGRLSRRELVQLAGRMAEWDADGDGKLREAEIPQQYRLTLSRGEDLTSYAAPNFANPTYAAPATPANRSHWWFHKMDRNRDGEVSAREFLGPASRFEKIDANADGAIDADEAAAVK